MKTTKYRIVGAMADGSYTEGPLIYDSYAAAERDMKNMEKSYPLDTWWVEGVLEYGDNNE